MKPDELLSLYDAELRRKVEITRLRREELAGVVRYIEVGNQGGFVSWAEMTDANADQVIDEQIAYFNGLVPEFEWKTYAHDQLKDLGERLANKGFTATDPEALLVMDLADAPAFLWTCDTSSVRRVTTTQEIDELIAMENEVWHKEMPRLGEGLKHDLVDRPELLSLYGVWRDGKAVSAAWQFFMAPTRWVTLYGGSTLVEYRKQGFYTALIAARAREARERGYRFMTVDASPASRPILEKHGFTFLDTEVGYEWKGAENQTNSRP